MKLIVDKVHDKVHVLEMDGRLMNDVVKLSGIGKLMIIVAYRNNGTVEYK